MQDALFIANDDLKEIRKNLLTLYAKCGIIQSAKGNNPKTKEDAIMKESTRTKDFSWILKTREQDGTIKIYNISDPVKRYKQGWYKTPKAAMKALQFAIDCTNKWHEGSEIIEAYCFTRSGKRF